MAPTKTESSLSENEVTAVELSSEEKAMLDEMIEEGKNWCLSEEKNPKTEVGGISPVIALAGALKNQTKGSLSIFYCPTPWAGTYVKKCPDSLDSYGTFLQGCITYKGIKAAVVYAGENKDGVECCWLLAWSDSKLKGRKVYAKCGRKSDFDNIDWKDIKKELKKASFIATAGDSETGTSMYAIMYGVDSKYSTEDAVLGIFYG